MSSDSSVTSSTGSRIRQFGLYRTIDARTEEFLRLSKKRQIKQGCACAAVSTAITVTIVVIILLIYEYTISVEWNSILNNKSDSIVDIYDNGQPTADRLYRSTFGFDQDYYERMPLLVNAMQENSYIDPSLDAIPATKVDKHNRINNRPPTSRYYKSNNIRKTSPRPFAYKTSTTLPFSKTYSSRSWVEKYRNAQRLKNIRQVIKYLEKTINAKLGDMHTKMPNSQVAFSGLYVEPKINIKDTSKLNMEMDLMLHDSTLRDTVKSNHYLDPLINFSPNNPGEVNLLADTLLKLSPILTPSLMETTPSPPMFRRISNYNNCNGNHCKNNISTHKYPKRNEEDNIKPSPDSTRTTTDKSFSVMLNLFPLKSALNTDHRGRIISSRNSMTSLDNIYLTTSRPVVKFKRKSTAPTTHRFTRKRPRILFENKIPKEDKLDNSKNTESTSNIETKMFVHVQVYTPDVKTEENTKIDTDMKINMSKPNLTKSLPPHLLDAPVQLSATHVEDFHVGSSGVIPIHDITTPTLANTASVVPYFDSTVISETHRTNPSDIFTFSHDDAKIPDQYLNYHKLESETTTEMIGKTTEESITKDDNGVVEILVIKLKNDSCNKTATLESTTQDNEEFEKATTPWTYVPQINGHYRSMNPHSIDSRQWLDSDSLRKRNPNRSDRKSTYVPMYGEIKRNFTKKDEDFD